ncbi:DUF6119 family protein [Mesorhizobium sp.]|uniref:DUF6119 family protein n=1 Tax=Mesorhizobium sp. TaxID=1871066 RepID=UPI00342DD799
MVGELNGNDAAIFLTPLDSFDFKVVFGIITYKNGGGRSDNLPLFSKVSLMRNMQQLDVRRIPSVLVSISDHSPKNTRKSSWRLLHSTMGRPR